MLPEGDWKTAVDKFDIEANPELTKEIESLGKTAQNSNSRVHRSRAIKMYRATSIRNFEKAKAQTDARQSVEYFFGSRVKARGKMIVAGAMIERARYDAACQAARSAAAETLRAKIGKNNRCTVRRPSLSRLNGRF